MNHYLDYVVCHVSEYGAQTSAIMGTHFGTHLHAYQKRIHADRLIFPLFLSLFLLLIQLNGEKVHLK